jgi:hypothetical protein
MAAEIITKEDLDEVCCVFKPFVFVELLHFLPQLI